MSIKNKIIKMLGGYTFEDMVRMQDTIDGYRHRSEQFEQQLKEAAKRIIEPVGAYMEVPYYTAKNRNDEQIKELYTPLLVGKILEELVQREKIEYFYKVTNNIGEKPIRTVGIKLYIASKRKDDNDE